MLANDEIELFSNFDRINLLFGCLVNLDFNDIFLFTDMLIHKQLMDENLSLDKWMDEVNKFLHAEEVAWGDVDVLEAQLEQSNVIFLLDYYQGPNER